MSNDFAISFWSLYVRDKLRQSKAVRQDKAMLHDGESLKMEEKHGHHKNPNGHKYFMEEIPQGFLP